MAKSKAISTTVNKSDSKASYSLAMEAVDRAIAGAKNLVQTLEKLEPLLASACMLCLEHAQTHGDVMPAHRLVTGLPNHPSMKSIQSEIVAWFRANSPIWWDSKGEPHQAKEGEPNYKPYNPEGAADEAFYERPQAKKARAAAAAAHKRNMEPVSFDDFKKRVLGLSNWLKSAKEPNKEGDIRGVKKGDEEKIAEGIKVVTAAFEAFASEKKVSPKASKSNLVKEEKVAA